MPHQHLFSFLINFKWTITEYAYRTVHYMPDNVPGNITLYYLTSMMKGFLSSTIESLKQQLPLSCGLLQMVTDRQEPLKIVKENAQVLAPKIGTN